jgi:hypothetical protein
VKIRSQVRATLLAIFLIVTWLTLPLGIQYLFATGFNIAMSNAARSLLILSPTVVIRRIESGVPAVQEIPDPAWAFYLLNAAFYGVLLCLFRHVSLEDADQRPGRTKGSAR